MSIVSFNNIASLGIAKDPVPVTLPANDKVGFAWTDAMNMRFKDGYITKMPGYELLFNCSVAPYFSSRIDYTGATSIYLYAGLSKVYCMHNGTHYNITRQTTGVDVDYHADKDHMWNMTTLNNFPVLTNLADTPQAWTNVGPSNRLVNLPNWPTNYLAKVIRSYKAYLIALDVTNSLGNRNKNLIKWSTGALPGALPTTWDISDPTADAGEYQFSDSDGWLVDCLPLNDFNIIYKNSSTYIMSYVGGTEIFSIRKIFPSVGLLAPNCAAFFKGKHFAVTSDDVIVHDGFQYQSVIDGKNKRYLFKNINPNSIDRTFVVPNYENAEMWICFPTGSSTYANSALIFNYETGVWTRRALPETSHISSGFIDITDSVTWQAASTTWANTNVPWDKSRYNKISWSLSMCVPTDSKIYLIDKSNIINDNNIPAYAYLERINFPLSDDQHMKFVKRIWLKTNKVTGSNDIINVHVGTSLTTTGEPVWQGPYTFNTVTDDKLDCLCFGRYISIRISTSTDLVWELHGFDVEVDNKGKW